jgi:phage terminase large subunit-like protein
MRSLAYKMPTVERDGAYRYARSRSGQWVMHEWALEDTQDREDMEVVKTANPASWQTVEALRERRDDPSTTPWQWARFACGVWLQGEDTAIGPLEWAACGSDEEPPTGLVWRLGVDLAAKEDTTAIVPHALDEDGVAWLGAPTVLVPPAQRGVGLTTRQIMDAIGAMIERYDPVEVVIDEARGGDLLGTDIEDRLSVDVRTYSQKPAPMAQAAERHPRDDTLTRHVLNARRKGTDDGRWRFVKENAQSKRVIDALVAAAMAHNIAIEDAVSFVPPPPVWA